MKAVKLVWRHNAPVVLWLILGLAVVAGLLLYKLATLTGGLSATEVKAATQPVGWQGILHDPFYLPLKLVRSVVYFVAPDHGQLLTRLPNALFGGLTMISFAWLIWLWHGRRTAILTSVLFATSAWVLHTSRLASFDVLYLWAVPTLCIIQVLLHRHSDKALVWYGSLLTWGLLAYVPGMIWLIGLQVILQRKLIVQAWRHFSEWWQQVLSVLAVAIWLPLLVLAFTRVGQFVTWLGLPTHWDGPFEVLKHLVAVPVHLFIRGPQYPEQWLGRTPIFDAFTLVACLVGIYFYAKRWDSARSRTIGLLLIVGGLLVAAHGPVSISLLVPLLYAAAATGIAYLLHDWLKVFPVNPLARGLGIGLVGLAVAVSCLYNLRAYFVAWPHNTVTKAIFRYHR